MKRSVTPLTRHRAFATIKIVAKAMLEGEKALTYGDLKKRLGMPKPEIARGLGPILDEAAWMCKDHRIPDVSAVIVTKESMDRGAPMPSDDSFNADGFWVITGLHKDELPDYQKKVQQFDWMSLRSLGLSEGRPEGSTKKD